MVAALQLHEPGTVESTLRAAVAERIGEARFGLWFGEGVRLAWWLRPGSPLAHGRSRDRARR